MDRLKLFPMERVGLPDAEDSMGGKLVLDESFRRGESLWLPTGRTTGQAATPARIFGGFDLTGTPVGAASATLNQGTGIFPYLDGSDLKFGILVGHQDPASQILDYSSEPDATYAVYVRARYNPATTQNRVFWNPSGAPAREYVDSIPTRDVATWEVISQDANASPPGNGEWVKIWEITVVTNLITAVVDFRHFFYEGSAHPSDAYAQEWGDAADDRNDDRTLAPVTDQHRFAQMVRRALAEIRGIGSIDTATDFWTKQRMSLYAAEPEVSDPVTHSHGEPVWKQKDFRGYETRRMEVCGRLATSHRFYDDFTYHQSRWGLTPGDIGPYYDAVLGGGLDTVDIAGNSTLTPARAGGWVAMHCDVNALSEAQLFTQPLWQWRVAPGTQRGMISMWARAFFTQDIFTYNLLFRVGLLTGTGAPVGVWWECSSLSGLWTLNADDGAGGTNAVAAAAVTPQAGWPTQLYVTIDPFANGGVGRVYGSVFKEDHSGAAEQSDFVNMVLPGVGATFLSIYRMLAMARDVGGAGVGNNAALVLDAWEGWDNLLLSGSPEPDKSPLS